MTFNPGQPRDGDGQWTDGTPGSAAKARDALKVGDRIHLGQGEALVSSGRVGGGEFSTADAVMAVVSGPAGPTLRFGVVNHDETRAWTGSGDSTITFDEQGIGQLWDAAGALDDEIAERKKQRTADEKAHRDRVAALRDQAHGYLLGLPEGERKSPEAARVFRQMKAESYRVDQDEAPGEEFYGDVRTVSAAGGGRLHYQLVGTFDPDDGRQHWQVNAAVEPPGAGPGWSFEDAVGDELHTSWEPKQVREMARMLDRLTVADEDQASVWLDAAADLAREAAPGHVDDLLDLLSEAAAGIEVDDEFVTEAVAAAAEALLDDDELVAVIEAFDPSAHPRAAAGTAAGGQFAAGGGPAAAGKKATAKKKGEVLSFDAKSGRGVGYGKKGGDARVRKLQAALNRLGLTDADGRRLVVDGKLGPRTTAAIKAAQKKLGLAADGKVTPQLLVKLVAAKAIGNPGSSDRPKATARMGNRPRPKPGAAGRSAGKAAGSAAAKLAARLKRAREADMTGADIEDATEGVDRIEGRVLEAAGTATDGSRMFRVRIISAGDSKNGRRYPAAVLREAVDKYEGAKAYDHHRSAEELRSSTITGLVGWYRNVEASDEGLDGDLVLLPGATHTAEALDATVAAQAAGLPPLVGISHDALTYTRPVQSGRRRLMEAVSIARVNSADVVADPAAGGKAVRVLAGGIEETDPEDSGESNEEEDVPLTSQTVLAALKDASPEDLAAVGLSKAAPAETTGEPEKTAEAVVPAGVDKASFLGSLMIREKVTAAGLPEHVTESLRESLPDRITESGLDASIATLKAVMGVAERSGLVPTATAEVTKESLDKKKDALDRFFSGDYSGYRSFRSAYLDVTGYRPRTVDEDLNKRIMRESIGELYDSGERTTESLTTSSWDVVLGDSITRRMVAMYAQPSLQNWRPIVSSVVPVNDFRTQRIDRLGGYGTLPAVNQGAPYQPLTSPGDEEVTYAITKRGGTEDLTLEMIANDDVRAIGNIPKRLGLAAARTLHNFVWDFLATNPTLYDTVALFHATHANTTAVALSQSNASTLRQKMRDQTGYGDTSNILSLVPKYLIVPNELEELAFQICTSAVAIPSTPAGPSDTPNLHQSTVPIVVDYLTDANDWFMIADPNLCPTIEIGFYQGRQEPELFTQSDQTVGSMFNNDKLTYKIRHIYSGAVLEYRGMQRGTQ